MKTILILAVVLIFAITGLAFESQPTTMAQPSPAELDDGDRIDDAVELGTVRWTRDLAAAQKKSAESGKPIFVLFQEVPGCQTCQDFGQQPMSHPLIVEAIEDHFIPVLVYNNREADAQTLKDFQEPSWNNPVVRYLDSNRNDVIARKDGVWTTRGTAERMVAALKAAGRTVPAYLQMMMAPSATERASFAMHCYWEGEAKLATIDGVLETQSAWRGNLETVELTFDPQVVDYGKLLQEAQKFDCASKVYTHSSRQHKTAAAAVGDNAVPADSSRMRPAKLSDQLYYLRNSSYRHLPLTKLQAIKINGLLLPGARDNDTGARIGKLLSPRQRVMLDQIKMLSTSKPDSLNPFVWPHDDEQLGGYAQRLSRFLNDTAS